MLNAILPIFLLILIGFALKKYSSLDQPFWDGCEKITYYLLFPCLLLTKTATADLSQIDPVPLAYTVFSAFIVINLITFALKPTLSIENSRFSSLHQGAIRFNTYIGLALVGNLLGENGLVIAVVVATLLIPIINVTVIFVLQIFNTPPEQNSNRLAPFPIAKNILSNPLILGCLLGITINLLNLPLPYTLLETLTILGKTSLPLGLLCVGAALTFKELKGSITALSVSTTLKLAIYPIIAYGCATYFGLDNLSKQVVTLFCALPTATASYIMAKKLGGDAILMARIITIQTVLSLISLLFIIKLLNI